MLNRYLLSVVVVAGLASSAAMASIPGFYIGGQAGYGNSNYTTSTAGLTSTTSTSTKGIAGHFHGGYQFDQNWAVEFGYLGLSDTDLRGQNGGATNGIIAQHSWTLLGKGIVPFENGFEGFVKLGLAHNTATPDAALIAVSTIFNTKKTGTSLAYGIGAGYDLNSNANINLSWQRTQSKGSVRAGDLLAVGVDFHFG